MNDLVVHHQNEQMCHIEVEEENHLSFSIIFRFHVDLPGFVIANQYNEIGSDPHPVSRSDLPDVPVIASLPVSRREIFTKSKLLVGTEFEPENHGTLYKLYHLGY